MADNTNETKVTKIEKKENGLVRFFKKHGKTIAVGAGCFITAFGVGYAVCSAVHYNSEDTAEKIDKAIDDVCTPDNAVAVNEQVPSQELDDSMNPDV